MGLRAAHEQINRMVGDNPSMDPERVWRTTHEMIVTMTDDLPIGQCMRLKGEELLGNLDIFLPQICEWLGIRQDAAALDAMLHPEASPYACEGPRGATRGNDPNFLENPKLDLERLARMREPKMAGELDWRPGEVFQPATYKLAKQLGYF